MIAGFAATVLIAYNGIIDKPGTGPAEIGVSLDYGYWVALLGGDRDRDRRLHPLDRERRRARRARHPAPSRRIASAPWQ